MRIAKLSGLTTFVELHSSILWKTSFRNQLKGVNPIFWGLHLMSKWIIWTRMIFFLRNNFAWIQFTKTSFHKNRKDKNNLVLLKTKDRSSWSYRFFTTMKRSIKTMSSCINLKKSFWAASMLKKYWKRSAVINSFVVLLEWS